MTTYKNVTILIVAILLLPLRIISVNFQAKSFCFGCNGPSQISMIYAFNHQDHLLLALDIGGPFLILRDVIA